MVGMDRGGQCGFRGPLFVEIVEVVTEKVI